MKGYEREIRDGDPEVALVCIEIARIYLDTMRHNSLIGKKEYEDALLYWDTLDQVASSIRENAGD